MAELHVHESGFPGAPAVVFLHGAGVSGRMWSETAVRPSNAALASLMPNATAHFVPRLGHGWLGTDLDLHIAMVEAWLGDRVLPGGLQPETIAWPRDTVEALVKR